MPTMPLTEKQYERIGQWLDGENISLNEAELAAAKEMRRDETLLAGCADVACPSETMQLATRRMLAELARPQHFSVWVARLAAAVAVVVITAGVWLVVSGPDVAGRQGADVPLEVVVQEMEASGNISAIDLVAGEIESLEADLVILADLDDIDAHIDSVESEIIDDLLLDDAGTWPTDNDIRDPGQES
ncbi:MAG: hypothetical protein J7M14_03430 [Planctomycetes bacterium]|nr:hypothetical protein [Planctomycetota bacterium]